MTRLIDANALHEKFYDLTKFKQDKHTGDWVSQRSVKISDALRMINDAPTVKIKDIIVRCKDCKHKYEEGDNTHYYWCRLNDRPVDDDDFCSWGEER